MLSRKRPGFKFAYVRRGRRRKAPTRVVRRKKAKWSDMPLQRTPFPSIFNCVLRYDRVGYTITSAGGFGTQSFGGNCLYDPDITGAGAQPTYYDQLCTSTGPYNAYTVKAARITVEFLNQDTVLTNVCIHAS